MMLSKTCQKQKKCFQKLQICLFHKKWKVKIINHAKILLHNVFRWEPAIEVPGGDTKATVPDLTENEEYEFRVIAVNKGGNSDPSEASVPVVAKPRNCESIAPSCEQHGLCKYKIYGYLS